MNLPFALGTATSGIPLTTTMQTTLQQGMQGGAGTTSFVQSQIVQNNFFGYLNENAGTAWTWTTDESGNPAFFAAQKSGDNQLYVEGRATIDLSAANTPGAPSNQFTWNGQTYNIIGTITTTLGYNTTPLWYTTVPIGVATLVPSSYLAGLVWSNVLKPLMQGAWAGIKSCISGGQAVENPGDVDGVAEDAAEDAGVDGAEVGEDTVSLATGAIAFGAMAFLAAIPILISILAHDTFHQVQFYNLTTYDIYWSLPYQASGTMSVEPVTAQSSSTPQYLIPAMSSYAPPGLTPVNSAQEATFIYTNTNELEGLGYVLQFGVNTAGTQTQVDNASVMFSLPLLNPNSLATATGNVGDVSTWYQNNSANLANRKTQSVSSDSNITITATYDYLSGKHPGPGGQDLYYYNSVVVIAPAAS